MSFKEKLQKYYLDSFMKKNGDRLTQVQGNVVSIKIEEKTILWIFHKITAILLVRPDRSKTIVRFVYKRNRWFKKPTFMNLYQGNLVIVQGMKAKKRKKPKDTHEAIEIMNVRNLTTKKDLVPMEGAAPVKRVQKIERRK